MSRIGNKVITVPAGVEVSIVDNFATVKGPKGELKQQFDKDMTSTLKEVKSQQYVHLTQNVTVQYTEQLVLSQQTWLKVYQLDSKKKLELIGVGYRAQMQG